MEHFPGTGNSAKKFTCHLIKPSLCRWGHGCLECDLGQITQAVKDKAGFEPRFQNQEFLPEPHTFPLKRVNRKCPQIRWHFSIYVNSPPPPQFPKQDQPGHSLVFGVFNPQSTESTHSQLPFPSFRTSLTGDDSGFLQLKAWERVISSMLQFSRNCPSEGSVGSPLPSKLYVLDKHLPMASFSNAQKL